MEQPTDTSQKSEPEEAPTPRSPQAEETSPESTSPIHESVHRGVSERPPLPAIPIPTAPIEREFDPSAPATIPQNANFDPTAPRPDDGSPLDRVAGEDLEPEDAPGTMGFIQEGYYYTRDGEEPQTYIYVNRVVGDGGIDGHMGKLNHLRTTSIGPTADQDREYHNSRRALSIWATRRMTRAEMPSMIPENANLRTEREYHEARELERQNAPIADYKPSERPS